YGLFGMGWGTAKVDNGSTDLATGTVVKDADLLNGINVNVGAGVALYTLPWVTFFGQAVYRFGRYESVRGLDGKTDSLPDIDSDSWSISAGAALRILPPRK